MTVTLPSAFESFLGNLLDPRNQEVHVDRLRRYMNGGAYTGAAFETLTVAGHGPHCIDVSDLAALWTLSVPPTWEQSKAILVDHAEELSSLLAQLPDRPLASLSGDELEELHAQTSPAMRLWRLIRGIDDIGPVMTSKLMARKRPQLIPIYDSFVKSVLGLTSDALQWRLFHEALSRNGGEVEARLLDLGREAGHPELSALRVFDIVVWMQKRVGAASEQS